MTDARTPVLIGAGQLTQRDVEPAEALGPLEMMVETARRAATDAGVGASLLRDVDTIAVANVLTCDYVNAPRLLAERIGAQPARELYSTIGGNTPQWLVNETAVRIATGEVALALLAGAEAVYSFRRARRARVDPAWARGGDGHPTVVGDARPGTNAHEIAHGLVLPAQIYPLFENALRAHYGWTPAEHRERLGVLCSRLSAVAAENPYAWFPVARTPSEIATPTADNRMIGFPYTKYMNAIMDVDQSAAVLMTSAAHARGLGVPEDRWVYLWASAEAAERWWISERRDYHSAPALRAAGEGILAAADIDIGRVRYFDLYSCFPSAVQVGRDMLGVADQDQRALTVTGGLPYAGGPGNNYSMHAIATMVEKVRADPGAVGLITALGWYLTKHAIGIYGGEPPSRGWRRTAPADDATARPEAAPELAPEAHGRGVIETFTVIHEKDGTPVQGVVIGRQADGRRFLANTPDDRSVHEELMAGEAIGRAGRVASKDGLNRFDPS